jgi:HSP20 family protein
MVNIQLKPETERTEWVASSESRLDSNHFHWQVNSRQHAWRPPTDVYISDDAVIVRVEIAGMRDGEFSITFEDHTLSIRGSRPDFPERRAYHQMEIRFGEFRTDIGLQWPVNIDGIDAAYKDGFLRVILPIEKPQNIKIQE